MKRAFTMLELVFVIVITGILTLMVSSSFQNSRLQEAADQVMAHIRYTQHLAMIDDKFSQNSEFWYKHRWTIRFVRNLTYTGVTCDAGTYNDIWSYMIYNNLSCSSSDCNTNPNKSEIAQNPSNQDQLLSGGYNNDLCIDNDNNPTNQQSMEEMRLGEKYGIQNITFSGGCRSNVNYISFDYLGRPFNSFPTDMAYEIGSPGWHKLLTSTCKITLSDGSANITIAIEPETGYTHVL